MPIDFNKVFEDDLLVLLSVDTQNACNSADEQVLACLLPDKDFP